MLQKSLVQRRYTLLHYMSLVRRFYPKRLTYSVLWEIPTGAIWGDTTTQHADYSGVWTCDPLIRTPTHNPLHHTPPLLSAQWPSRNKTVPTENCSLVSLGNGSWFLVREIAVEFLTYIFFTLSTKSQVPCRSIIFQRRKTSQFGISNSATHT